MQTIEITEWKVKKKEEEKKKKKKKKKKSLDWGSIYHTVADSSGSLVQRANHCAIEAHVVVWAVVEYTVHVLPARSGFDSTY